ncbi:hypothetical protein LPJ53_006427 [Coemansia erecta]|uniref:Uncharacterized protein n=1 Tax=Coemansia erecta TaxID=147472 RepID=A0A9W8CP09_9FUNG|nr:hypothetical protein LPJ53_006427 [Coemansia erecta]
MDGATLQEPGNVHSLRAVETAVVVLHLRTTTQIDELMRHASVAIQQRWEYLGPSVDKGSSRQPPSTLFRQIDDALQWQSDDIGEYIRHEHFALELTEEQKDTLCPENVVFEYTDHQTLHAYVPFGSGNSGGMMVVDLVWESDSRRWVYFNVKILEVTKMAELATTVVEALKVFKDRQTLEADGDEDDDDYWGQFVQPERPADRNDINGKTAASNGDNISENGYWGQYDDDASSASGQDERIDEIEHKPRDERQLAILKSVELSLRAAAVASQASGVSEAEFLQMAYQQFHAAERQ